MSLILDKNESFSMSVYAESPGYQRVVLSGYLLERRADGAYLAPLLPQLFYGANGAVLSSWRQYLPTAGNQVILSRSGGLPTLPREDLYWRKVSDNQTQKQEVQTAPITAPLATTPNWLIPVAILGIVVGGFIIYKLAK